MPWPVVIAIGGGVVRVVQFLGRLDQRIEKTVKPVLERSSVIDRATRVPPNVMSRASADRFAEFLSKSTGRYLPVTRQTETLRQTIIRKVADKLAPHFERAIRPIQKALKPITEPVKIARELYTAYRVGRRVGVGPVRLAVRQAIDPTLNLIFPLIRSTTVARQVFASDKPLFAERLLWVGYRGYVAYRAGERGETLIKRIQSGIIGEDPPPVVTRPTVVESPTVPSSPPASIVTRPTVPTSVITRPTMPTRSTSAEPPVIIRRPIIKPQ